MEYLVSSRGLDLDKRPSELEKDLGLIPASTLANVREALFDPVLLYGVENWLLCATSILKLESFQGELAKWILKLPKWFSNTAAKIALGWPSMHSIVTIRKLKFLARVTSIDDSISWRAFCSLIYNAESLCLVKECRELEERYSVHYTSVILFSNQGDKQSVVKDLTLTIQTKDQALQLQSASDFEDLCRIASVIKWKKLWDHALDHGETCISSLRNLVRIISHPTHALSPCPLCDIDELSSSLPIHIIETHTNISASWDTLLNSLLEVDSSIFGTLLGSGKLF